MGKKPKKEEPARDGGGGPEKEKGKEGKGKKQGDRRSRQRNRGTAGRWHRHLTKESRDLTRISLTGAPAEGDDKYEEKKTGDAARPRLSARKNLLNRPFVRSVVSVDLKGPRMKIIRKDGFTVERSRYNYLAEEYQFRRSEFSVSMLLETAGRRSIRDQRAE